MFKRKTDSPIALYSDTVRSDLRAAVLAIASGDFDRLQSTVFDLTDGGTLEWMEARRLPGGALWTVERHMALGPGDDDALDKKTVLPRVCFFDALAYVAQYEQNRLAVGTLPSAQAAILPHYRDVAAALGQPIDRNGKIHPAVDGHALTDGLFSRRELAVAEKSGGIVPVKPSSLAEYWPQIAPADSRALAVPSPAVPAAFQAWDRHDQAKLEAVKRMEPFNAAAKTAELIQDCIDNDVKERFYFTGQSDRIFMGVLTLVPLVTPLVASIVAYKYAKGKSDGVFFSGGHFLPRHLSALKNITDTLPDGEAKSCMEDFARAAQPAYHLEKAIAIFNLCKHRRIKLKHFEQGLREIDKAGALMDWDEGLAVRMKAEYQAGRVPEAETFFKGLKKIYERFDTAREQISRENDRLVNALATPKMEI